MYHPATGTNASTIDALLRLHNRNRGDQGVPPLKINNKLSAAAQAYAEFLANSGKFGHTIKGTPGSRAKAQGYHYHAIGENIAAGQPSPKVVVNGWMHSKGHRENILRKAFKEVGFGVAKTRGGRLLWVTDFGSK